MPSLNSSKPYKVVVVGGGAGGLELVTRLGRRYRRREKIDITLVDRSTTHLWKPLLHEVAAGTLNSNETEISYLAQARWQHFSFRLGPLEALDRRSKTIVVGPSFDSDGNEYIPRRTFAYDLLVLAIGSIANDFGVDGVAEHCFYLDSRTQADRFHQNLVRACYRANAQTAPLRESQLQLAIAGAGATGVELAAELQHALGVLAEFGLDRLTLGRGFKIHLIEGSQRILPGLKERISTTTHEVLENIGVEVHTNELITQATHDGFSTKSGKFIPAEIKVWAAGVAGPHVLASLDGLEVTSTNQLRVRSTLQTTRDDDIYAFGDCAACPADPAGTSLTPPRAQAAHQQAAIIAKSIDRRLADDTNLPLFEYRDFGSLINLSQHSTIGNLMGNLLGRRAGNVSVEGRLARLAYLSLYKMHQIAVLGAVRTTLLTLANVLTRRSKPRLKLH